jgi:hypothetical protein
MAKVSRHTSFSAGVVIAVLALAACGASGGPSPGSSTAASVPSLGPGELALPTTRWITDPPGLCAGVGLDAVLHGDPRYPDIAWLENRIHPGPHRIDVVWPVGYRARFAPKLEVVDATGTVVLREGDVVTGACGVLDDGRPYLAPPFR